MAEDFFDKPFTEDTNVKLDLYREYLLSWYPVFIAAHKPFKKVLNLFDFFCGPGKDSEGTVGSPLIALEILNFYSEYVNSTEVKINLHFNDSNAEYIDQLKENVEHFDFNKEKINIHYYNEDFVDLFPKLIPITKNAANLIFLDQFGLATKNWTIG
jgi:three-Cys-motif partner protein